MGRAGTAYVAALVLVASLAGCRAAPPAPASISPTSPVGLTQAPAPTRAPVPSPTPSGRLPAVVAEVSLGLPGGDAYQPRAAALDEAGRAVVLCSNQGQPGATSSALIVIDPERATRGPTLALPGWALGPIAVAGGRAYVAYQDDGYQPHLAAVDLGSGRLLVDVMAARLPSGDSLAAGPAGELYALLPERLEVRDPLTLQVVRSVPYRGEPGQRFLASDRQRNRLYLAAGRRLQAYRTPELTLLWEAPDLPGEVRGLTVDGAGERVYVRCEAYQDGDPVARVLAFDADGGRQLAEPVAPEGVGWELVGADSRAGYLLFAEPHPAATLLWRTHLDGQPSGEPTSALRGWARFYDGPEGRLLALQESSHLVSLVDPVSLQPLAEVATQIEIRHLATDPGRERLYVNDSAGRLHVVDSRSYRVQATLDGAGSGALTVDAPNELLFVGREGQGREVAVVDTARLTVTAVITGGDKVAVDSVGRRAFVGWAAAGPGEEPGQVQVWDTRTFQRLGAIAQRGEPTYNPLRDEVYLRDYTAYVVDGKSLAVTGELTPDIGGQQLEWCSGCNVVQSITVDLEQELIVVGITSLSAGKGPGPLPQPRVFSARSREPVTHAATILTSLWGEEGPFVLPPDEGRVYVAERYARYVFMQSVVAYTTGFADPSDYRDGLGLDYFLPDRHVALDVQDSAIFAYDPRTWEPLGWIPRYPIHYLDPAGRRLYAWERSLLTVLSFDGGEPLPQQPPEPWPGGESLRMVQEIHFSPGFAHDRTVFVAAAGQLLRSTDGGASWTRLPGPAPLPNPNTPNYHLALSPGYPQDRTVFLGGELANSMGLGVWRSVDGGDTWAPLWRGLTHLQTGQLAISPRYPEDRTLVAYARYQLFWRGESGESVFRSEDGGASWAEVARRDVTSNAPPLPQPEELLPYPQQEVQFKLGAYGQELLRSGDGGRTWEAVLRPGEPGLMAPIRSPAFDRDGQVLTLSGQAVYRSTDAGLTWEVATDPRAVRAANGAVFTALAIALGADGRPVVALGDMEGTVSILPAGDLGWQWVAPPQPTPAPTPSPTPCAAGGPQLGSWPQEQLGCPAASPAEVYMAWQPFEGGQMFWRSDQREIYLLYSDLAENRWRAFDDTWEEGQPDRDPALRPPEGREQPIRGFGKVWREELGGPQAEVGWAMESEVGYDGRWQEFDNGLLFSGPGGQIYALFDDGTWD